MTNLTSFQCVFNIPESNNSSWSEIFKGDFSCIAIIQLTLIAVPAKVHRNVLTDIDVKGRQSSDEIVIWCVFSIWGLTNTSLKKDLFYDACQ